MERKKILGARAHFLTFGRKFSIGEARGLKNDNLHVFADSKLGHLFFAVAQSYDYKDLSQVAVTSNGSDVFNLLRIYAQRDFPFFSRRAVKGKSYKVIFIAAKWLTGLKSYSIDLSYNDGAFRRAFCEFVVLSPQENPQDQSSLSDIAEIQNKISESSSLSFEEANALLRPYLYRSASVKKKSANDIAIIALIQARLRKNFKNTASLVRQHKKIRDSSSSLDLQAEIDDLLYPDFLGPHGYSKRLTSIRPAVLTEAVGQIFACLEEMGCPAFLNSGTLLGAVRNGEFIPHDDDMDIAVYIKAETLDDVRLQWRAIKRMLRENFTVQSKGRFLAVVLDNDIQIDVFPAWEVEGKVSVFPYSFEDMSPSDILPLQDGNLHGATFPIPANPDTVLRLNYGPNWRTPDPTWKFDWKKARKQFQTVLKYLI